MKSPPIRHRRRHKLISNERSLHSTAFDIQDYVPYLLTQAHQAILPRFVTALRIHALSLPEWRVLAALHTHGSLRVRELLVSSGLEPATLSRTISSLQERQLTARSPSADDARGILVSPTSAGLSLAEAIIPHAIAVQEIALCDFSADERMFLIALLKRIPNNFDAASPKPSRVSTSDNDVG